MFQALDSISQTRREGYEGYREGSHFNHRFAAHDNGHCIIFLGKAVPFARFRVFPAGNIREQVGKEEVPWSIKFSNCSRFAARTKRFLSPLPQPHRPAAALSTQTGTCPLLPANTTSFAWTADTNSSTTGQICG